MTSQEKQLQQRQQRQQRQQHQLNAFDGWTAHVRYFLAQYPLETRHFVAQVGLMGKASGIGGFVGVSDGIVHAAAAR